MSLSLKKPRDQETKELLYSQALRNGLGLFETLKVTSEGKICFLEKHLNRLFCGIKFLNKFLGADPNLQKNLQKNSKENSKENLEENLKKNLEEKKNELRSVLKKDLTIKNKAQILRIIYLREIGLSYFFEDFPREFLEKKNQGVRLSLSSSFKIEEQNPLAQFKSFNYLKYKLALAEAQQNSFDDSLLLNYQEQIVETSKANIFFQDQADNWFTPTLSSGCLAGIIRGELIKLLSAREQNLRISELGKVKFALICNSLIEVLPVSQIGQFNFNAKSKRTHRR